jgi:hypothetical protein
MTVGDKDRAIRLASRSTFAPRVLRKQEREMIGGISDAIEQATKYRDASDEHAFSLMIPLRGATAQRAGDDGRL